MKVVHVQDKVDGAVYIGRWNSYYKLQRSPFHNPYKLIKGQPRGATLELFRRHMLDTPWLMRELPSLRGKTLACWCRHDGETEPSCHGDVLIDLLQTYNDHVLRNWS